MNPRLYRRHATAAVIIAASTLGALSGTPAVASQTSAADDTAASITAPVMTSSTYFPYTPGTTPPTMTFSGTATPGLEIAMILNEPGGAMGIVGTVKSNGSWGWSMTGGPTVLLGVHNAQAYTKTASSAVTSRFVIQAPRPAAGKVQVFKQKSSPTLYRIAGSGATLGMRPISYAEWVSLGKPAPLTVGNSTYIKYPWSRDVFEVTYWGKDYPENGVVYVNADQWKRLGYPTVHDMPYEPTLRLIKWATSDEIFARVAGRYYRISYDQWRGTEFKSYINHTNQGFVKLANSTTIYAVTDLARNKGVPLTYEKWRGLGSPTPRIVKTAPVA
ncbi:hypothetical protein JT358_10020 [Micrococcales bacterium 31B]|nr:hypothetical protein [Micrococcales bacterium 31B]